ncbi:1,4-dihydroxy-2-naphthoate polyprenyltransferase [Thermomicrobium sp. 4228-Ro]|uniref:1,4-dihydroxy-2-naphthoate polyprenyltransferase n=1 Tax=Thermomicrobium sp. 4228-Ro TaxID=2993937 RepID=UPI0022490D36|nr:1,4-dihydroxy-2-naphthoate polyprenyltransferase [Thermomicrobium sp. 4228-Ro]MCX2728309.1 1,4-dihydroxy-2-naphthoate polyprenyltransferase [Thermomicrobium sp. 4228-Ro]
MAKAARSATGQGVLHPGWRVWWLGTRPATLVAAVGPVLVGTAVGVREAGAVRWLPFLAALAAAILIQVGTNYANDLFDYLKGADRPERVGPARITARGLVTAGQMRWAVGLTFGAAALLGLYLVWVGGWPILAIGLASIAAGILYTAGPWPLGYIGLGDLFVFVFFGLVAVGGSAYLQTGSLSVLALAAAVPVGALITAILVVNNLRDIPTDRAAGKRTLAVRIGERATRWQYTVLVLGAYLVPLLLWISGWTGPTPLLAWLTLPLAVRLVRVVLSGVQGAALNPVLKRTGQLQLLFAALFAVGLLW